MAVGEVLTLAMPREHARSDRGVERLPSRLRIIAQVLDEDRMLEVDGILEQQRCANQERYLNRLQQTHADVQPYSLENLRKGGKVLINAHLQVDGFAAHCGVSAVEV